MRNFDARAEQKTAMNYLISRTTSLAFLFIGACLLSGCAASNSTSNSLYGSLVDYLGIKRPTIPVQGVTIANPVLQRDVLDIVLAADGARHKECKNYGVSATEIVEPPRSGDRSKWKERWVIDRCGTAVPWDVEFTPAPNGGTYIAAIAATIPKQ